MAMRPATLVLAARVLEMRAAKLTTVEISRSLGISQSRITALRRAVAAGTPPPKARPPRRRQSSEVDLAPPNPEALTHSSIEWIKAKTYERAAPVARRTGLHVALARTGALDGAEYLWVERYVAETEILAGGRLGKPDIERVDEWPGPRVYNRTAAAAGWLRIAHGRMSRSDRDLIEASCVKCYRVCDVAVMIGHLPDDDETMENFRKRIDPLVRQAVACAVRRGAGLKPIYEVSKTSA